MDQRQLFLRDVLTILFKRKGLIVLFAVVVIAGVFVGNMLWPKTFESTAKLQLLRGRETLQPTTPLTDSVSTPLISMTKEDVNSEIQMIYSDDVLRAVAQELQFQAQTGPVGQLRDTLVRVLTMSPGEEADARKIAVLRSAITVKQVKDSYTMELFCRWPDPVQAQQILQIVIDKYKLKHNEVFSTPAAADEVFTGKTEEIRQEWSDAQQKLRAFRESNNVYGLEEERDLVLEQYTKSKKLALQLEQLETVTQGATPNASGDEAIMTTLGRETESTVITELRLRLLELMLRRNEIVQSKGPNHPDTISISNQIEQALERLKNAIDISAQSTNEQIAQLEDRLKQLNNVIDEHDALVEEAKIKQDAYVFFAERVQEARVNTVLSDAGINNITVVSQPSLATSPIRPRKLFNLLLGVIVGIVGGVALAFFFDYLDHGIKTPEDMEHYLGVAPLASFLRSHGEKLDPNEVQRLSAILDAVHSDRHLQIIEVASSVPGEGGNRVARALAEVSADDPAGPTLLVDLSGDGIKEAPSGRGIVDLIMDGGQLEDCVSSVGQLYVMGRGSQKDIPTYVWKSEKMKALLDEMRQRFSRIIFYTPPVLRSGEAVNLARLADGIVVVVKFDSTRREVVMRAMELLAEAKGRVLGAVLTDRKQIIPSAVYKRI
ncbi:MAG: hypothetical protein IT365_05770 [Candidatus Hydrogenedentes bacterium]|nr:hypothetical protein [Candidatus Hydrogenedentota bacterium]